MEYKGTLLIVEDEKDLSDSLRDIFSDLGYRCLTASNGLEGLGLVLSNEIDAVLSDIAMPTMTGLEMLAQMRSKGRYTPLVFLTAYSDKEKIIEALRLGAMEYVEKPLQFEFLCGVIEKAVRLGAEYRQIENEIEEFCRNAGLPPAETEKLKALKRRVLMTQKVSRVHFGKAS